MFIVKSQNIITIMGYRNILLFMVLLHTINGNSYDTRDNIIGGDVVQPHSIPYQISLQLTDYGDWPYCGGVLVTDNLVLTTGYCCSQVNKDILKVVAGEHDLNAAEGTEQEALISEMIIHQDFDPLSFENDICLLKLDRNLNLNDEVGVIRAASSGDSFSGQAVVSGWGVLEDGGLFPDELMSVSVTLRSDDDCRGSYGANAIKESMLCAGDDGKDSCQGDAGGPLVCQDGVGRHVLCGLVSWGLGCGRPGYYGVYTEVAFFKQWIDEITRQLSAS